MKYVPPIGGADNAPYVDGDPSSGVEGSAVPAAAIEHPMREIVSVIAAAGLAPSVANLTQLLSALRSTGVFQTAPQFDTSTKAATMAAVQRALGNRAGDTASFTSSGSIPVSACGQTIIAAPVSPITLTLPAISDCPNNGEFFIVNFGVGTITVQRAGADVIANGSTTRTSFVIPANESARIINSNTSWQLGVGDALLGLSPEFGSSLAASGYQKLPSGFILQWGVVPAIAVGALAAAQLFPISFPQAVYGVIAIPVGTYQGTLEVFSVTTSQVTFGEGSGAAGRSIGGGFYFAFGK